MFNRRQFLLFLGASFSTIACQKPTPQTASAIARASFAFSPLNGPMPLPTAVIALEQQRTHYQTFEVVDDLVLPEGYTYDVIAQWGDRLGDSRVGYNNDYLSLVMTGPDQGFLTANFEYISAIPWLASYQTVMGKALSLEKIQQAVQAAPKPTGDWPTGLNAFALADTNPIKREIQALCREALIDQGMGVMAVKRGADGRWQRVPAKGDRRITGISGLTDGRYLKSTGPARLIFQKTTGKGYVDQLGDKIIGTFQNCAGGTTPWGTVLSGEENIQTQVPEPVHADGTAFDPKYRPFRQSDEELTGLGNVFGLAGNKYGWIVEVDPANPNDYGTKHTWLGRYRHEAVGVRVEAGKPLAFYSGCDRRGGHLYKFVSRRSVKDPKDKANSQLLSDGQLYVAQFNEDGTGRWIALTPKTPVQPNSLAHLPGGMLPLPKRPEGGIAKVTDEGAIAQFAQRFKTLGDLYTGTPAEQQGAILIDAHFAANAAGATCTARPEDTEIAPDGTLFITFTSGSVSDDDGSADRRIFKGPDGTAPYEYGWIMKLTEEGNQPAALTFRWTMLATGGEPSQGGGGFSNPDNLAFDPSGNLWIATDMSSDKLNHAIPADRTEKGKPLSQSNLRGMFGNNGLWCLPLSGPAAGRAHLFAIAPMDAESTGPWFTDDGKTLFLSIQHPGEINGIRRDMQQETRTIALRTTDGQDLLQTRTVPIGSNWPSRQANDPPRPAIVAIRRQDGAILV